MHLHTGVAHTLHRKLRATAAESMPGRTRWARTVRSIHSAAAQPAAAQTASAFRRAPMCSKRCGKGSIRYAFSHWISHEGAHPLLELLWIYLGVGILRSQQTPCPRALSDKLEWLTRTLGAWRRRSAWRPSRVSGWQRREARGGGARVSSCRGLTDHRA